MKRLLLVPVVVLLAAVIYIFFVYDPNPSKNDNNGASITLGEPQKIESTEIGSATVKDAVEFEVIPVTIPPAEDSSDQGSQSEVVASDEGGSSEPALSDEAESTQTALYGAADDSTEKRAQSAAIDDSAAETTTSAAVVESAAETTTSAVVDDSAAETTTSAAVDDSAAKTITSAAVDDSAAMTITSATTEDSAEEAITSVEADTADSSEGISSAGEDSLETASPVEEMQSQSIVADNQQQPAGAYIEHKAVIISSLYQATNDAGLSANQSARIGKIFEPHLDSRRELREGDKLTIFLDPGVVETGNDADQVHRLEFHGARKNLVVTRKEQSLSDYEVRNADGKMLSGEASQTSVAVEEPRREEPTESAQLSEVDDNAATGGMKRLEGVVTISLFSAAREAGLNVAQLKKLEEILTPYLNFNKEVHKGDRIVIMLDRSEIHSCKFIGAVKKLSATRDDNGVYKVTDSAGRDAAVVAKNADSSSQMQSGEDGQPVISQAEPGGNGGDEPRSRPEKTESAPEESSDTQNGDDKSGAKKPFWKRLGFGSSSAIDENNWKPSERKLERVFNKVAASGKVARKALVRAFKYYEANRKSSGLAQTNIAIADYTKLATTKRLHIINLKSAAVTSVQVAHGRKSGPIGGRVTSTSNANGSNKTTKGFYKVGTKEGRTNSKGYPFLHVQGLESHNRLVGLSPRKGGRDIIIHTAEYVASGGRSLGCFSIRPQDKRLVFGKLKGTLFFSYVG